MWRIIKMDLYKKRDYLTHMLETSRHPLPNTRENLRKVKECIKKREDRVKYLEEKKTYKRLKCKYKQKYLNRPIEKLDKFGNVLNIYKDLYELQRLDLIFIPSCIIRCCEGVQIMHYDYMWRFA